MGRKVFFAAATLLVMVFSSNGQAGTYSGGTGEPNNPFRIATPADMNEIGVDSNDWDKNFVMTDDIDLAGFTGDQFNLIGFRDPFGIEPDQPFTGVFDGNGFAVYNFSYADVNACIGLFCYVDDPNAVIKNITLIDPNIDAPAGYRVGSLIGYMERGTVSHCGVDGGRVLGYTFVGGLVGSLDDATMSDCYAKCDVTGIFYVAGGMLGHSQGDDHTIISNCYATGAVNGNQMVGGLVGLMSSEIATISDCYATGDVNGTEYTVGGLIGSNSPKSNSSMVLRCYATGSVLGNYANTGGLIGYNRRGQVASSYATGEVSGYSDYIPSPTGGLIGTNVDGVIENCYATGTVHGNKESSGNTGGLIGSNEGPISYCYATGFVDGNDYVGGLVGENDGGTYTKNFWDTDINPDVNGIGNTTNPNVIAETTIRMKKEATFTDWDFVEIWNIGENQTYPYLRVYTAGDLNHDGRVDMPDFAILAAHWLEEK